MDRDRNLLFGVLAVQLGRIGPEQLVEVAGAWATDPSRDLWDRLAGSGALSQQDCRMLLEFVEQAVKAHGGDATATLAAFGGIEQVHHSFQGTLTMSPEGHLVTVTTPPPVGDTADLESIRAVSETPGRYTYLREHGRGGMGRVLLVHDAHLGRDIALKELLPGPADADGQPSPVRRSVPHLARFLAEACITSQLEHPSIVPVYELGRRTDGTLYYTMKLVRGRTLQQRIREAGSLSERLKLLPHFVDLCQAIAYAHSRNVIHRDIKPGNVMVGEFGETVVLDWGVAKVKNQEDVHATGIAETLQLVRGDSEGDAARTEYGQIIGTPCYMSPEQAKGDLSTVDERSDVYSLGTVLYELLTGHPPHEGGSARDVVEKVVSGFPVSVRTFEPQAPAELVAICERAMRRKPGERYKSAKELAEEVERFQSGALVQAYQYGFSEYAAKLVKRHKSLAFAIVTMLLIVMSLSGYYVVQINRANVKLESALTNEVALRGAAEDAQNNAESATRTQEEESYVSSIRLAENLVRDGQFFEAQDILWGTREDLRNWEWGYLCIQSNIKDADYSSNRSFEHIIEGSIDRYGAALNFDDRSISKVLESLVYSISNASQPRYSEFHYVLSCEFSLDGKSVLLFSSNNNEVKILHGNNNLIRLFALPTVSGEDNASLEHEFLVEDLENSVAYLGPVKKNILIFSRNGHNLVVYHLVTGNRIFETGFSTSTICDARLGQGEEQVVVALTDKIVIFDIETKKIVQERQYSSEICDKVKLSHDARVLLVINKGNVEVTEVLTGNEVFSFLSESQWPGLPSFPVVAADINLFSTQVILVARDGRCAVFDLAKDASDVHKIIYAFNMHKNTTDIAYGMDGVHLLQQTGEGGIYIWDLTYLKELGILGREGFATFTDNGTYGIRKNGSTSVSVFNLDTSEELMTIESDNKEIEALTPGYNPILRTVNTKINRQGSLIAMKKDEGIDVYRIPSGELLLGLRVPEIDKETCFSFIPNNELLLCWSREHDADVWDISTGKRKLRIIGFQNIGRQIEPSFSSDGKKIIGFSAFGLVIWDLDTGVPLLRIDDIGEGASTAVLSPDGNMLAIGSDTGELRMGNPWTKCDTVVFNTQRGPTSSLFYTKDNKRLVSASLDGNICIWNSKTGQNLITLSNPALIAPVFVTGSTDGRTIMAYDLNSGSLMWNAAPWIVDGRSEMDLKWRKIFKEWRQQDSLKKVYYNHERVLENNFSKELFGVPLPRNE